MKDIIWTLVIGWLIYKIVNVFRLSQKKQGNPLQNQDAQFNAANAPKDEHLKKAIQKHLNKEGEYVDFEEIKK